MAGHPSVWPLASHLPCQGRMRVQPLLVDFGRSVLSPEIGPAAIAQLERIGLLLAIRGGKAPIGFPPSSQRKLGSLFCFRRFVRRSEIPAFAGMTTVDGNTWSNVLGICDEYQVEGWTPVFAGMTEMGGFQAFCPCRGGRARSVGRRWRAGERGTPLRQHFVLPPPLTGEDAGLLGAACGRLVPGACLMRALGGVPWLGRVKAGCRRAAG